MLTAGEVHLTIQEMNNSLSAYDDAIAIGDIATALNVTVNELETPIDTLAFLRYLKYTDKRKANIRLTFSGENTLVPPWHAHEHFEAILHHV